MVSSDDGIMIGVPGDLNTKFEKIVCGIVRIIGIIVVGYLFFQGLFTICCIQRVEERTFFIRNGYIRQILGIAAAAVLVNVLLKTRARMILEKYGRLLVCVAAILMLIFCSLWVINTRFIYSGDMEKIWQYADMMLRGDYSGWEKGGYPYEWSQNNCLILLVSLLLKCFGLNGSFVAFYFFNIVSLGVAFLAFFGLCKKLTDDTMIQTVQVLGVILYFPYAFLITMLYSDIIGASLCYLSVMFMLKYLEKRNYLFFACSCLFIIFGVNVRQNGLIMFCGIVVILIVESVNRLNKKNFKTGLLFLAATMIFICTAFCGFGISTGVVERITGKELGTGNSRLSHIAMGIQESDKAPGWYNCYVEEVFSENEYDTEKTAEAARSEIVNRLSFFADDPSYAWSFFNHKIASMWNNPTFECFHIQNWRVGTIELSPFVKSVINDGGKLNIILIELLDILQSITLFGVLMYLLSADDLNIKKLLPTIIFLGGFVFHIFWEAKCRYVLPYYTLIIPYSFLGYVEMIRKRKIKTCLALFVIALFITISDNRFLNAAFKLYDDTESYYGYIHEFNQNFMNFRF